MTITTPFTSVTGLEKNFRPGCGPCCRKSSVRVNTQNSSTNSKNNSTNRSIDTSPAEVDNVYNAVKDTWEKQKMIMAGLIRTTAGM